MPRIERWVLALRCCDTGALGRHRPFEHAGRNHHVVATVQRSGSRFCFSVAPAIADGGEVVVWPQVTTGREEATTDEAWTELTWLTPQEIEAH